ncbi:hypothetical protein WN943_022202 [Citrus x changshan-huyou]
MLLQRDKKVSKMFKLAVSGQAIEATFPDGEDKFSKICHGCCRNSRRDFFGDVEFVEAEAIFTGSAYAAAT